jgi:flavin-dependent dehydrogenase
MDEFIRLGGVLKKHKIALDDINQVKSEIVFGNERMSYKFLFGADGSNSVIRKLLDNEYKPNGLCVECDLSDEDCPEHLKNKIQIYFGVIEKGYGWVFPKNGKMTIGVGGSIENIKDIKLSFKEFLLTLGISKEVEYTGATIPYGKYPKNINSKNILLIGDSAGLVDPITGEGIYFSIYSGKAAAECVSDYIGGKAINANHAYSNQIKYVYDHINAGNWLQGWMFNRFVQNNLFKLMNGHDNICRYFIDKVVSRYEYTYKNLLKIVIAHKVEQNKRKKLK